MEEFGKQKPVLSPQAQSLSAASKSSLGDPTHLSWPPGTSPVAKRSGPRQVGQGPGGSASTSSGLGRQVGAEDSKSESEEPACE